MSFPRIFFQQVVLSAFFFLLAAAGAEIYLRIHPPLWIPAMNPYSVQQYYSEPSKNPAAGYIPKAGASGIFTTHEFKTQVSINRQHMRGSHDYSPERIPGVKRILLIGDSFVFGWGVNDSETSAALLEKKLLHGVEVLNLGVSGYCSSQALARLQSEGLAFQPDIVLFFTAGNPSQCTPEVRFENGKMLWASEPTAPGHLVRSWLMQHSYFYGFVSSSLPEVRRTVKKVLKGKALETSAPAPDLRQGFELIEEFQQLSLQHQFLPVIIHFHDAAEVRYGFGLPEQIQFQALKDFIRNKQIPFLDLMPPLKMEWERTGESPYFQFDPHWNRRGHEIAAEEIAAFLERNKILPAESFKPEV